MNYFFIVLAVIILLFAIFRYSINYSKRLLHIGLCAAQSYILYGDESAKLAARVAAASISSHQKQSFINYIQNIPTSGSNIDENAAKQRLLIVCNEINEDGCGSMASDSLKSQFVEKNDQWLLAVNECNYQTAQKQFEKLMMEDMSKNLIKRSQES